MEVMHYCWYIWDIRWQNTVTGLSAKIPRYSLYGNEEFGSDPNFVHAQPLFSDIERQNWRIAPHRHAGLHQLVFLQSGLLDATIDNKAVSLVGPTVVSIPTDCVHGFGYSPDVNGHIVTISEVLLRAIVKGAEHGPTFSWLHQSLVIQMSADASETIDQVVDFIRLVEKESNGNDLGKATSTGAAVTLLLVAIGREFAAGEVKRQANLPNNYQRVMLHFQSLVRQNYREHLGIDQYCEALGVTRKQLGRICNKLIGMPPLNFVHEQLIQEAQRRLIYTNASVTEVSFDLGFGDPSYFSRFFRKQIGTSPNKFARMYRQS